MDDETNWRDEAKRLEQQWMVLKDQYSEIARALGYPGDGWWGDPLVKHEEILNRAHQLRLNSTRIVINPTSSPKL